MSDTATDTATEIATEIATDTVTEIATDTVTDTVTEIATEIAVLRAALAAAGARATTAEAEAEAELTQIRAHVRGAERRHADDTTVPLLAKGGTKTARLWTCLRDAHLSWNAHLLAVKPRQLHSRVCLAMTESSDRL